MGMLHTEHARICQGTGSHCREKIMKSSKERVKKFRERLKEDKNKYEEAKKKDRERKKSEYLKKKSFAPEALRAKERERKRKQRQRKAESKKKTAPSKTKLKISPQVLGRALNRAKKHLPRCPEKKVHVLAKMVQDLSPRKRKSVIDLCDSSKRRRLSFTEERKKRSDALSEEDIKKVQEFYERDDISRMFPGKKDYMSVKQPNGKREHCQKRQLLYKIGEAHQLFKEESNLKIEKSKFAELRPPHVVPLSSIDQEVCICIYHENLDLLLQGISKVTNKCLSSEEAVSQTVCNLESIKCVDRDCSNCGVTKLNLFDESIDDDSPIFYYQWQKVNGAMKKLIVESTLADASEHLESLLAPFSRHVYNVRRQFQELKYLKQNLKDDEIIVHEDFSENFQLKQQREVMASHWSKEMVTLFTAVVYHKEDDELRNISYAVVSDDLTHEKGSIYAFNKEILNSVSKKLNRKVATVHYWTDGVWSQFKNRYNLTSVLYHPHDFGCEATWNFFETAHGKGAPDGVGAAVKRTVWRTILQNRAVVQSAQEFANVAKNECQKVEVLYVSMEEINEVEEELLERWDAAVLIPETRTIHFVKRNSSSTVCVAKNSQFQQQDTCLEHCLIRGIPTSPSNSKEEFTNKENGKTPFKSESKDRSNPLPSVADKTRKVPPLKSKDRSNPPPSVADKTRKVPPLKIENKLPKCLKDDLSQSVSYTFPNYQEEVVSTLLEEGIVFRGGNLITTDDLKAVSGKYAKSDEDKWLSNFVIDSYLQLLASVSENVIVIKWEIFEKAAEKKLASDFLKKNVFDQNYILTLCNKVKGTHWFLLCVLPKMQSIVVLDSAAGDFIKPTHKRAISKMWRALLEVNSNLNADDWQFYVNASDDIQQQITTYDCGVYVCMYARSLLFGCPLVQNDNMQDVRKSIIHDLHFQNVSLVPPQGIEVGSYYAVDYVNHFYYGRVILKKEDFVNVKFLHANSATTFNWPRRDDVERVHISCVFYGPIHIQGNGPFTVPVHSEVCKVHQFMKRVN